MERRVEALFWLIMGLAVLLFGAQLLVPARVAFSPAAIIRVACVAKLLFLLSGAVVAFRCAGRLEVGNPARSPWILLSLGLFSMFMGQVNLARYQFSSQLEAPFPSLADLFFVSAYPFFIVSLATFVRAYVQVGYSIGSKRQRWVWIGGLGLIALALAGPLLLPILRSDASGAAKALNIAYPSLDLILLVPTALLLRASLPLRGGRIWLAWATLLAGFVFMSAGDVLFAYFSTFGVTSVDPLVHATFIVSYGCLGVGVLRQHALLGQ